MSDGSSRSACQVLRASEKLPIEILEYLIIFQDCHEKQSTAPAPKLVALTSSTGPLASEPSPS